jgi:hypothetical protein
VSESVLVQKGLVSRTTFVLQGDAVSVDEASPFAKRKYIVLYESIPRDPVEVTLRSKLWRFILYLAVVIFGSAVFASNNELLARPVLIFWGIVLLAALIRYAVSKTTYLIFQSGTPALVFRRNRPSEAAVQAFIARVQERKAEHLRTRFLDAQGTTPAAEIHKLAWLKEQGAISDEEFARLKRAVVDGTPSAPEPGPDTIH